MDCDEQPKSQSIGYQNRHIDTQSGISIAEIRSSTRTPQRKEEKNRIAQR